MFKASLNLNLGVSQFLGQTRRSQTIDVSAFHFLLLPKDVLTIEFV